MWKAFINTESFTLKPAEYLHLWSWLFWIHYFIFLNVENGSGPLSCFQAWNILETLGLDNPQHLFYFKSNSLRI